MLYDPWKMKERYLDAGFKDDQAEALVKGQQEGQKELATKTDLDNHRKATKTDLDNHRKATKTDLDNQSKTLHTDLDNQSKTLHTALDNQSKTLHTALDNQSKLLKADLDNQINLLKADLELKIEKMGNSVTNRLSALIVIFGLIITLANYTFQQPATQATTDQGMQEEMQQIQLRLTEIEKLIKQNIQPTSEATHAEQAPPDSQDE